MLEGGALVFLLAMAAWISVREAVGVTEIQRRIMWASSIGLCVLPAWLGWGQLHVVQSVAWPFLAGVMAGELAWGRFQQWRLKRERAERERQAQAARGDSGQQRT